MKKNTTRNKNEVTDHTTNDPKVYTRIYLYGA